LDEEIRQLQAEPETEERSFKIAMLQRERWHLQIEAQRHIDAQISANKFRSPLSLLDTSEKMAAELARLWAIARPPSSTS
jgi:hypothetical protein